jgi:replication initiation and membrane attachment protein DnaB
MTEAIVIRFTKKDKEYLSKLATKYRLTLSSFLRSELLNSLTSKPKLDV